MTLPVPISIDMRGEKIKKICLNCGKEFYCYPYEEVKRKFCSHDCEHKYRKGKTWEEIFGKDVSDKAKIKLSKTLTGQIRKKEINTLICLNCSGLFDIPKWRKNRKFCSFKCYSKYQSKMIKHSKFLILLKGGNPTDIEQKIIDLCKEFNLPFRFVGDGSFWLGNRNPDFNCIDNKRLLIEVYANFWKKDPIKYKIDREKHFRYYGYETLFLDDRDLYPKNWKEVCLNKINRFLEENKNCMKISFILIGGNLQSMRN